jgi:hypothetical protein
MSRHLAHNAFKLATEIVLYSAKQVRYPSAFASDEG